MYNAIEENDGWEANSSRPKESWFLVTMEKPIYTNCQPIALSKAKISKIAAKRKVVSWHSFFVKSQCSVKIQEFSFMSDFTWNQFWQIIDCQKLYLSNWISHKIWLAEKNYQFYILYQIHLYWPLFWIVVGGGRTALLFCELVMDMPRPPLHCPPTFKYLIFSRDGKWMKFLMRGDANGRIALWKIPDTPECASMQLKKVKISQCRHLKNIILLNLSHFT